MGNATLENAGVATIWKVQLHLPVFIMHECIVTCVYLSVCVIAAKLCIMCSNLHYKDWKLFDCMNIWIILYNFWFCVATL